MVAKSEIYLIKKEQKKIPYQIISVLISISLFFILGLLIEKNNLEKGEVGFLIGYILFLGSWQTWALKKFFNWKLLVEVLFQTLCYFIGFQIIFFIISYSASKIYKENQLLTNGFILFFFFLLPHLFFEIITVWKNKGSNQLKTWRPPMNFELNVPPVESVANTIDVHFLIKKSTITSFEPVSVRISPNTILKHTFHNLIVEYNSLNHDDPIELFDKPDLFNPLPWYFELKNNGFFLTKKLNPELSLAENGVFHNDEISAIRWLNKT